MTSITIISDIHFGAREETLDTTAMVDTIRDEDPEAIFVLGDVIHEQDDDGVSLGNLKYVAEEFERLGAPTYFLGGNHDANAMNKYRFEKITGTTQNDVIALDNEYVAIIDSAFDRPYPNTGFLGDEAIDTIEKVMQYDPTPIVMTHFPIVYTDGYQHSEWFSEYPEGVFPIDKKRISELDETPGVVMCGHLHIDYGMAWVNDGIYCETVPPYTQFDTIDDAVHHGALITVDTDKLRKRRHMNE